MKKRSKRYKNIHKDVKSKKANSLKEVFEIIKKNSNTKFDESVDVSQDKFEAIKRWRF